MRRLAVAAVALAAVALSLCALVALSGCSDTGSSPNPGPTRQADPAVTVTGTFRLTGGPYPGIDWPLGGTVVFEGPVTERVKVGANGTFTVGLLPGEYTVTGVPERYFADAKCQSASATIASKNPSKVEVGCYVE